jgi:hypothetical protein
MTFFSPLAIISELFTLKRIDMNLNLEKTEVREIFFNVFKKSQNNERLEPLEKQIIELIQEHSEYQEIFLNPEKYKEYNFSAELQEENPFLHLGLHLTLLDQITTNRPKGITAIYKDLVDVMGNAHHAEHHMMEILHEELQQVVHNKKFPDEKNYLKQLKKLLKKGCIHHH